MPYVVRLRFTLFKHRLNKNTNIHDGPRQVPKTSTYHLNHQLLPTPTGTVAKMRSSTDYQDQAPLANGQAEGMNLTIKGGEAQIRSIGSLD